MSHFSLMVVTDGGTKEEIDKALDPFNENVEGDEPWAEFEDKEDEYREQYATDTIRMYRKDGELCHPFDEKFRIAGAGIFGLSFGANPSHAKPDDWEEVKVPFSEVYPTFEEFAEGYHGYKKGPDSKTGRYGYWKNPNAKWDWYTVGGRFKNRIAMKCYYEGVRMPSVDTNSCRVRDLDLEAADENRTVEAKECWLKAQAEEKLDDTGKKLIYGIEPGETFEQYVKGWLGFSTFAVLMDGKWYEKGEMGWWGVVTYPDGSVSGDECEDKNAEWRKKFAELLASLPPEKYITVVDCHI